MAINWENRKAKKKENLIKWRERNQERNREYERKYRARATPEKKKRVAEVQRAWEEATKEIRVAKRAAFRKNNSEKLRAKQKEVHDRDKAKNKQLKYKFGINLMEYEAMLAVQNGGCKICTKLPGKRKLAVDHDHKTGKIRGLLCNGCNVALGSLRDRVDLFLSAIVYLQESSCIPKEHEVDFSDGKEEAPGD